MIGPHPEFEVKVLDHVNMAVLVHWRGSTQSHVARSTSRLRFPCCREPRIQRKDESSGQGEGRYAFASSDAA
jgi:hypothetical protein